MKSPSELELIDLFDRLAHLAKVGAAELPEDLKTLKKFGFGRHDDPDMEALDGYDAEQMKRDRQRVVRVGDVENVLLGFEDQILSDVVTSPSDSVLAPFVVIHEAIKYGWPFLKPILKAAIKRILKGQLMVIYILAEVIVLIVATVMLTDFRKIIRKQSDAADFYAAVLRELALPQRTPTRHRVRKRTRD